jgi:hypothetical protein
MVRLYVALVSLCKPFQRQRYFAAVVGLVWSNEPESYAGGRVVTGRVSLAGQVKGDDPE